MTARQFEYLIESPVKLGSFLKCASDVQLLQAYYEYTFHQNRHYLDNYPRDLWVDTCKGLRHEMGTRYILKVEKELGHARTPYPYELR